MKYTKICGIGSCSDPVVGDTKTCQRADHQAWHDKFNERWARVSFKGTSRIIRRGAEAKENARLEGIVPEHGSTGGIASMRLQPLPPPPIDGQEAAENFNIYHRYRAAEIYCVETIQFACSVPIGWGKCYRSESPSQVLAFLNRIFELLGFRPSFIAYDNACSLLAHIFGSAPIANRSWHNTTRFIVDAFHYITHRTTDDFCRIFNNPAPADGSQPDLVITQTDAEGVTHATRAFNLETAEQLNAWLAPYEGPLKQMTHWRFDFTMHVLMLLYTEDAESRIAKREAREAAAQEREGEKGGDDDGNDEDGDDKESDEEEEGDEAEQEADEIDDFDDL